MAKTEKQIYEEYLTYENIPKEFGNRWEKKIKKSLRYVGYVMGVRVDELKAVIRKELYKIPILNKILRSIK